MKLLGMIDAQCLKYPIHHDLSGNASHPIYYPRKDEVTAFLPETNIGFHLPYCDLLQELCNYYGVASTQVYPNALCTWVGFTIQGFNRSWVYSFTLFQTLFRLQSNAFFFLFQTSCPKFKYWNTYHLSWDVGPRIRGIHWLVDLNPLPLIGRTSISFLKGVSPHLL